MIIKTKVLKSDADLEELGISKKGVLDIDLNDVSGITEADDDNQCVLLFKGYHLVIDRDYEQTRLEWLQTKKK